MSSGVKIGLGIVAGGVVFGGAYWWWSRRQRLEAVTRIARSGVMRPNNETVFQRLYGIT